MQKLTLTTLLSFFLAFQIGNAQEGMKKSLEPSSAIPTDPNVKIGKLDNGLTYYIRNNGKPEDKLELRLAINAGSILEDKDQLGLAHFMEHMNFNGTKNFKKNELVDYLQSIGVQFGADLNAYTSFDETVYILPIPSDDPDKLEKGFQILEDWAHGATLTDEAIDGERGVVLEEYRLGLGPDKRMMQEYLPKMMYGSKYAERLPIGKKEILENFKYKSVRNYFKDWYRPDLMAVVAVGDLDPATTEKMIKDHFGKIKKVKNPRKREVFDLPNHEETFIAIASDKEAAFSRVQVMYKDRENSTPTKTVLDYRTQIVRGLFSTMLNNRLNELRNSSNPPFVFGFSYYGGTFARNKNAYQSSATTSPEGQLNGLRAMLTENERVRRHGFNKGEFERAKKEILARLEKSFKDRDKQESGRIVNQYVYNYLEESPIPGIEWSYDFNKKVMPTIELAEINDLIKGFIHDDNRVIVLTGPEKEGLKKVTEKEVLDLIKEVEAANIQPYEDEEVASALIEKLPVAGTITNEETNGKLGITKLTLSNGATVTYKKTDFKNDEILFQAYSPGGTSLYSDEEFKATTFANGGLSQAGIAGLSLNDMNKYMSGKIVRVNPSIGGFSENFRGSAAPKDIQTLFEMVHLYFTSLNKNDEAFQSYITKQKSFLGNLMANPQFYFSNEIGKVRNKGNSRYVGFPTAEAMEKADYDLAYKKYQERFADAGDFHFYFVGNVDEAKIKELSTKYLASLPGTGSNEKYVATKFRRKDAYHKEVIKRGKDPKSRVQITWEEADIKYDGDEAGYIAALGEVLTIKLVEKLREEEGGVYGVGARGSMSKISFSNVTFNISFPCGPENADKLVAAALAEVEKIKKEGPTEKDLNKVKETYLLNRKESLKQNRFWMSNLVRADQEGRDINKMNDYEKNVKAMTQKDIQKVAKKYLDENYFLALLMPEDQ